ncbi:MAG: LysE family transporter [Flavobacteriales bacterium]|nr:LysE family transporter [Flavobacteriales bacterium]
MGLATALLLGPVFFTLLRAALAHGFKGGALVALGIFSSDVLALSICAIGARAVLGEAVNGRRCSRSLEALCCLRSVWCIC